ncbi:MAG: DUF3857 domain-containing protein [Salinivirgaceae bacterium]|nr:DUF3857 domain-containing protein [Salinivirgaceae bacterium]
MSGKKLACSLALMAAIQTGFAENDNWATSNIPDSLMDKEHNSVVRCYDVNFDQTEADKGICTYHRVVTVLNKKGDDAAAWSAYEDQFRGIAAFRGRITDATGNVLTKIKKSDLHLSADGESFASDDKIYYYVPPTTVSYPYTVEYEWQIKYSDGLVSYPVFSPLDYERQSMQECHYTLTLPLNAIIRERQMNLNIANKKNLAEGGKVKYQWTVPARRGVVLEDYSPMAVYQFPCIRVNPPTFTMQGTKGKLDSWESLGQWLYELAEGRDALPQSEIDKVKSITAGLSTNREKTEALYKYHGKKTRYVSIQLGIGGYQPMMAQEVSKTGFGDCKALSNYMKALLKVAGIESYLVGISTTFKDLSPDFPNFNEINHVILCVPDGKDTLWIDGTATSFLPFGYISPTLAGHECLLEKSDGGKLIRVPDYAPEVNIESVVTELFFNNDFSLRDAIYKVHGGGRFYEKYLAWSKSEIKQLTNAVSHKIGANGCKISELKFENATTGCYQMNIQCHFTASYGKVSGSRTFVPAFNSGNVTVPKFKPERKTPLVQYSSASFVDTVIIHIPDGLEIESLPKWVSQDGANAVENVFGSVSATATVSDGNLITIVARFTRNACNQPIERKDELISLLKTTYDIYNSKIVLKKK